MVAPTSRRAALVVPGGSDKMLLKAASLPADEIVLDLEDGVGVTGKAAARKKVREALDGAALASRAVAVRINAIGTPWCHEDIIAIAGTAHRAFTLVVPKLDSAGDLAFIDRLLLGIERATGRSDPIGVQGLIETPAGLSAVSAIAAASPRLQALILGYGDLASALGRPPAGDWSFPQQMLVLAARSNGLLAVDGPFFAYDAAAAGDLARASASAAALGFDGKWAIHPNQLETITAAFTPGDEEVRRALAIVARLDAAQAAGEGVATFDGAMLDEAMRAGAQRVLARAGREARG